MLTYINLISIFFILKKNIINSFHLLQTEENEITCILDSLTLYLWMAFCNVSSVSFVVETWYLSIGMTGAKTLYILNNVLRCDR